MIPVAGHYVYLLYLVRVFAYDFFVCYLFVCLFGSECVCWCLCVGCSRRRACVRVFVSRLLLFGFFPAAAPVAYESINFFEFLFVEFFFSFSFPYFVVLSFPSIVVGACLVSSRTVLYDGGVLMSEQQPQLLL